MGSDSLYGSGPNGDLCPANCVARMRQHPEVPAIEIEVMTMASDWLKGEKRFALVTACRLLAERRKMAVTITREDLMKGDSPLILARIAWTDCATEYFYPPNLQGMIAYPEKSMTAIPAPPSVPVSGVQP